MGMGQHEIDPDSTWADPEAEIILMVSKGIFSIAINLVLAWVLWGWWWQLTFLPLLNAGAYLVRTTWEIVWYVLTRRKALKQ